MFTDNAKNSTIIVQIKGGKKAYEIYDCIRYTWFGVLLPPYA